MGHALTLHNITPFGSSTNNFQKNSVLAHFKAVSTNSGQNSAVTLQLSDLAVTNFLFKASALWDDAFYKSKCLSVCVSVPVFTFEVPIKRLFAPTSRSWMSNIFRDLESLGKNSGNTWSQI